MDNHFNLSPLGFVASGRRSISSGTEYNKFFDLNGLQGSDPIISQDGTSHDTLREMESIAQTYQSQAKKISGELKASTLEGTLKNVWNFLYHNVQYKKDSPTQEQLRTPLRTWKDRKAGVDCDCYSIFISAILRNLGISHAFRMAAYKGDFQHVYVVVGKGGKRDSIDSGNYITIDPVVDKFDYEVPFTKKFDRYMRVQILNGLGETPAQSCNAPSKYNNNEDMIRVTYLENMGYVITEKLLTENKIPFEEYTLPNGSVRYSAKHLPAIVPVLTQEEAVELIKNLMNPPVAQPGPQTSQKHSKALWWILGISGALILVGGGNTSSPPLSGVDKNKKPRLKTLHI